MKEIKKVIEAIFAEKVKLSSRAGTPIINPTQRNDWKRRLELALVEDLNNEFAEMEEFIVAGKTNEGVLMNLEHPDMLSKEYSEVPIQFEIGIKNLDYRTEEEIEEFALEQKMKEDEKKAKAEAKASKIKRDKENREKKRLEEEEAKATE